MWADRGHQIDAQRRDIDDDPTWRLRRVAMQQRAMAMGDRGGFGYGLDRPGLVIGQHQRHQNRLAALTKRPVREPQIDDPVGIDRDWLRPLDGP